MPARVNPRTVRPSVVGALVAVAVTAASLWRTPTYEASAEVLAGVQQGDRGSDVR